MNKPILFLLCLATAIAAPRLALGQMGPVGPSPQILDVPTGPAPAQAMPQKKANAPALPQGPEDKMRDPFWPTDYAPAAPVVDAGPQVANAPEVAAAPSRNWEQAQKGLSIKGIMNSTGGKYLANVNNQILKQNDTVSVFYDGQKYTWKVSLISAKTVQFQPSEEEEAPKAQ